MFENISGEDSGPGAFPSTRFSRITWAENEILGICGVALEVIIEIFDKSSLMKTDPNWLFNILALSFVQLFVSPFTIRDEHQNVSFVSFYIGPKLLLIILKRFCE